jgi:predicted RNA-binding Zn-ribbon protein involved in translation (DUF1610 family)
MNANEYVHRLRRTATLSWLAALAVVLSLAGLGVLSFHSGLPFLALLAGSPPIIHFMRRHHPSCASCGARMRFSSGFPYITFRCVRCGAEVDTRIHADY